MTALRADLAAGAYLVEWWPGAIGATVRVAEQYSDSGLGLSDAAGCLRAQHEQLRRHRPLTRAAGGQAE